ncbi:DUF7126 family protein [Halovivax cerinus]|uniref:CTP synthetase n=1 Tax=Halovivax cerinus TaxID=1487865 RepID=A0ABD5NIG0_9EURY|nr:CTP synthetase [Halovivax cerinus]
MNAVIAGPDEDDLAGALETEGFDVTRIDDVPTRPALETAGITDAELFVLTDSTHATAVPIARDIADDLEIVYYTTDSLPEFVSGQLDFAVDPRLVSATVVAEELANGLE